MYLEQWLPNLAGGGFFVVRSGPSGVVSACRLHWVYWCVSAWVGRSVVEEVALGHILGLIVG